MEEQLEQDQIETPEVETEEPAAEQQPEAPPAPEYATKAELAEWAEQVKKDATEQARRQAQSWLDKHNQRAAARQTAAYAQADAMLAEVKDSIADEDMPGIRDRMARKAMETMPAPEPEAEQEAAPIPDLLVALIKAHGLDPADPTLHPSQFQTPEMFFGEVAKRGDAAREAKRHNPTKQTARDPMVVGMGSGGQAPSLDALRRRHIEAHRRGDLEEAAKLSDQIDRAVGG